MKLVSSQFDKQDKSVEALAARNQVLNKEIDAQKQKYPRWNRRFKTPPPLSERTTGARSNGRSS